MLTANVAVPDVECAHEPVMRVAVNVASQVILWFSDVMIANENVVPPTVPASGIPDADPSGSPGHFRTCVCANVPVTSLPDWVRSNCQSHRSSQKIVFRAPSPPETSPTQRPVSVGTDGGGAGGEGGAGGVVVTVVPHAEPLKDPVALTFPSSEQVPPDVVSDPDTVISGVRVEP